LDQLLKLLFEFLKEVGDSREPNAQENRHSIWECLCAVFDKTLLKAHKARYLPFLVFYHAKSYSKYPDRFLGLLKNKACDTRSSDPERIHAAAYLAGFVARAAYIHAHQMRNVFDDFVDDLHEYCAEKALLQEDAELKIGPASASGHIVFYALFQALMHMFNTRLAEDDEIIDKRTQWEQMQRIVDSFLCPLRYCLPATVFEFRKTTRRLDLLNFQDESDGSERVTSTSPGLDDLFYFPFEPMPLPHCCLFVNDPKLYLNDTSTNNLEVPDFPDFHSSSRSSSCPSLRDRSPALTSEATLRTPLTGPEISYHEIDPLRL